MTKLYRWCVVCKGTGTVSDPLGNSVNPFFTCPACEGEPLLRAEDAELKVRFAEFVLARLAKSGVDWEEESAALRALEADGEG